MLLGCVTTRPCSGLAPLRCGWGGGFNKRSEVFQFSTHSPGRAVEARPQQHLPWVAEVTRTAVMQRLHSTAARRAMAAAGDVFGALSGLCGGPCPASPGGHRSLAHQPGEDRESEVGAIPRRPWRRGLQAREGPVRIQHFHRQKPRPLARSCRGSLCFHPDPSRQNSPLGDRC